MGSFSQIMMPDYKEKWNESDFMPPLCTYRLNWARRTSCGWWDDWDNTVLQTQDSKFEPLRSEAEHATSRPRRLPQYWLSHVDGEEDYRERERGFTSAMSRRIYGEWWHTHLNGDLTLEALNLFIKTLGVKGFFFLNHRLNQLFLIHLNTYVMGLRSLEILLLLQRGERL